MIRGALRGVWACMIRRCADPKALRYGGRGITVCARWRASYDDFAEDVGFREEDGLSLDRIDNDAGYWCGRADCPDCGPISRPCNVRWARAREQARNRGTNRPVTAFGETKCIAAWSETSGLPQQTIAWRLAAGWSPERAVSNGKARR